jgi:NADH-quinone oxidoreductase subunit J
MTPLASILMNALPVLAMFQEDMKPVAPQFFFYFLSAIAVVSAILVITRKNPVHSAISLIFTLLSLAGLYLMLYAPFVAGVQIILYAGGIMVLFLFVIMLVNLERNIKEEQFNKQWLVGVIATLILGGLVLYVYAKGQAVFPAAMTNALPPESGNVQAIGIALYQNYMMPFEIASLLLLVAIVGAVVMAKKRI